MTARSAAARDAAVEIVRRLRAHGHTAYFAGGCVRDELLGLTPKDYDVATDAPPPRVRELFRNSRYVGEAFGVVLVRSGEASVEVATFRAEWDYADGRRPAHVEYADAQRDAQRRDFTINGLFEDPGDGRIIDYVGGEADLRAGIVRAIGKPEERFNEDYLRLLRAVRFAARLGFALEAGTAAAIHACAARLGQISRERIGQEVQGMLTGPNPALAVKLMQHLELDAPALNEAHQEELTPTVEGLPGVPEAATYATVLAAWLLDRHWPMRPQHQPQGDPEAQARATARALQRFARHAGAEIVGRWRQALVLSNEHTEQLAGTLELAARIPGWPELGAAGRKRLLAQPLWPPALALMRALRHQPGILPVLDAVDADAPALAAAGVAPAPLVTGDDLIALGRKPGPRFKTLLEEAYDQQLEGRVGTREAALEWLRQQGS